VSAFMKFLGNSMLKRFNLAIVCGLFMLFTDLVQAQTATVFGSVKDTLGKPIAGVNISIQGSSTGTTSNEQGSYSLVIPSDQNIILVFSFIGLQVEKETINLVSGDKKEINYKMKIVTTRLKNIEVREEKHRSGAMKKLDPKHATLLPNASGNFEAILKTLPGVVSNNELSSQYSVRGGNYDENLVYVNDIEIYRPFLVRSGQQEGLSFVNPDMVSSVLFSAGGFDARYGDKMSSVLDVTYKRPTKFAASAGLSLLGGSLSLEGSTKNHRLTYIMGARQKSNQYLLSSLDTKGDYRPSFTDLQTYVTYDLTPEWEIDALVNFSRNKYSIVPQDRETSFGTISEALKLKVYFDGQEVDDYQTYMGALSTTYHPHSNLKMKFISSVYQSNENETFDVQGQYFINALDKDLGSKKLGDSLYNIGIGTYLTHARNSLSALVANAEHKGYYYYGKHYIQWGLKVQHEEIQDKLNEWKYIDSSGFSLPQGSVINLQDVYHTNVHLASNRLSGYLQDSWAISDTNKITFNYGIRANYWDLNKELVVSPRASVSYKPQWKNDVLFRASSGYYYQPPFYRELRDLTGRVNTNVNAQKSIHFVLGSDYNFNAWGRPFKLVTEVYYKYLDNLVPYKIDNVRIRYAATNNATGYATGIDIRMNGEFVKGLESWASLSVMKTAEDIKDDYYIKDGKRIEPGYIPRPTDQRVTFGLFFQDYLPKNPTYKMHLNLVYGSGLPFGPPKAQKFQDTLRIPSYRRVDIGFSKQIIGENAKLKVQTSFLKYVKSVWVSAEIFNLLQVNNTISYIWIADVTGKQYAIPNYLTPRQINIRLIVKF
jgi:hypothetical protein